MTRSGRAALAMLAVCSTAPHARAQDTIPRLRHILPIDFARIQSFQRAYDITVLAGDSTMLLGQRDVALRQAVLADSSAGWLLTETRTGLVPSCDSLFLAIDLRPVRWTSSVGSSRLEAHFIHDSIVAVMRGPVGASSATLYTPPDLVLSGAMLELVVGLLPLSVGWADSVSVLTAELAGADVSAAEIAVVGEEMSAPGSTGHDVWIVALRAESRQLLLRVDKATGAAIRIQEALPPHVGTMIEIRARERADVLPPP